MAIEEGRAEPELLQKVEDLTAAMNEFRKDSINRLTGASDITKEQIEEKIKKCLQALE
jgi:hypothetical protein